MKCDKCIHLNACKRLIAEEHEELIPCEYFKDKSLVVELPCRIGDVVYFTGKPCREQLGYNECGNAFAEDGTINVWCEDTCQEKDIVVEKAFDVIDFYSIGETVFLAREEAEKVLERMDNHE